MMVHSGKTGKFKHTKIQLGPVRPLIVDKISFQLEGYYYIQVVLIVLFRDALSFLNFVYSKLMLFNYSWLFNENMFNKT